MKRTIPVKVKTKIKGTFLGQIYFVLLSLFLSINPKVKFYGQCGEDKLLSKYLPEQNGLYLDIGAGQPVRGSNTYYFYKKGWSGVLIEPIDFNVKLLKLFRRKDLIIQKLVGQSKRPVIFYEFIPTEYSTTIKVVADDLINQGKSFRKRYPVDSISVSDLDIFANPLDPSLLSIDVEGADFEVLNSINWSSFKPRVICIEASGGQNSKLIREKLESENYCLVDDSGISKIYLHNSYVA